MKIIGGICYNDDGITTSIRGMHTQTELMNIYGDNINGFNKVGYHRKEAVVSSFAQYIGADAISAVTDDSVGRLSMSKNPLDLALAKKGYFQYLSSEGIKQTRDGRFKLDANGYLTTLSNEKVLSMSGQPVKLNYIPEELTQIKIDTQGNIKVFNKEKNKLVDVDTLSVVSANGQSVKDIDVRQGYIEKSNVAQQAEFYNIMPVKRNFEANRQMVIMQNTLLSKTISQITS